MHVCVCVHALELVLAFDLFLAQSSAFPAQSPIFLAQLSASSAALLGLSKPILFGILSGLALVLGSLVGVFWEPSERLMGVLLAFAAGALVTAAAYELIEHAFRMSSAWLASAWLMLGAGLFASSDYLFKQLTPGEGESGWSLLASVTLDGVPENAALGIVLLGKSTTGFALVAAFFASNFPQALGGTRGMIDDEYGRWKTFAGWTAAAVVVGASVWVGYTVFAGFGTQALAALRALAGGAILASLADEVFPDAYDDVASITAVATALGFVMTYVLK